MKRILTTAILILLFASSCTYTTYTEAVAEYEQKVYGDSTISIPQISIGGKQLDVITEDIENFLDEYCTSFGENSQFSFEIQVDTSTNNTISIKYEGEVATSAKAIPQTFVFNYDVKSLEPTTLAEYTDLDDVYSFLAEESVQNGYPESLKYSYQNYSTLQDDTEHMHDFFFQNDSLFLIVAVSPAYGYYQIIEYTNWENRN